MRWSERMRRGRRRRRWWWWRRRRGEFVRDQQDIGSRTRDFTEYSTVRLVSIHHELPQDFERRF
jgi:hypothetical protein